MNTKLRDYVAGTSGHSVHEWMKRFLCNPELQRCCCGGCLSMFSPHAQMPLLDRLSRYSKSYRIFWHHCICYLHDTFIHGILMSVLTPLNYRTNADQTHQLRKDVINSLLADLPQLPALVSKWIQVGFPKNVFSNNWCLVQGGKWW